MPIRYVNLHVHLSEMEPSYMHIRLVDIIHRHVGELGAQASKRFGDHRLCHLVFSKTRYCFLQEIRTYSLVLTRFKEEVWSKEISGRVGFATEKVSSNHEFQSRKTNRKMSGISAAKIQ